MTNIFRAYYCLPVLKENNKYTHKKNKNDHLIKRNHIKYDKDWGGPPTISLKPFSAQNKYYNFSSIK